jgi:hypothetical protein
MSEKTFTVKKQNHILFIVHLLAISVINYNLCRNLEPAVEGIRRTAMWSPPAIQHPYKLYKYAVTTYRPDLLFLLQRKSHFQQKPPRNLILEKNLESV